MSALLDVAGIAPARRIDRVGGRDLHCLTLGQGPPVVLLHGAGGGAANWYRLLGPLSERCSVFAPDLPGFGLSASSTASRSASLGAEAAAVIGDWASHVVGSPFDVVGTSFGGLAALRLAQAFPDRVDRLVLLDSVGLGRELPAAVRAAATPALGRVLLSPSRFGTEWLFRHLLVADAGAFARDERAALLAYLVACARTCARTLRAAIARFAGPAGQLEVLDDAELRRVAQPALVLWGEKDRFLPIAHGGRAARLIPRSHFHVIADAGHSPNWEKPEAVVEHILSFLTPA
jgi:4,5:9,10-diseco-3-hydroxy-5,9,17-trioxoandrosta-1(10),2-diene-4-oate hydrolase